MHKIPIQQLNKILQLYTIFSNNILFEKIFLSIIINYLYMVLFFFYNKLTNIELLKKINNNFEIDDGNIFIHNYDIENNMLEISNNTIHNNVVLKGKIVKFNMKLEDVIIKINEINEIKDHKKSYTLETIWANKKYGNVYKAYIIY